MTARNCGSSGRQAVSNRSRKASVSDCAVVIWSAIGRLRLLALCQDDVRDVGCGNVLGAVIAELCCVDTGEEVLSGAQQDRGDGQMHLVDQPGAKVLPNRGYAAAKSDVLAVGGVGRSLKRCVDTIGDEMENRAAFHRDRCALVAGQHEDGGVIGRVVAPPPLPAVVGPGAA